MINREKILIYLEFKGFYEGYERRFYNKEKPISDEDWFTIDDLVSDAYLMVNGLSSDSFNENLNQNY